MALASNAATKVTGAVLAEPVKGFLLSYEIHSDDEAAMTAVNGGVTVQGTVDLPGVEGGPFLLTFSKNVPNPAVP
jgi:hypothetical protein